MAENSFIRLLFLTFISFIINIEVNGQVRYEGNSNVQLLFGRDFGTNDQYRSTTTLEHLGTLGAFEHFGFTDFYYDLPQEFFRAYLEWYPKISVERALNNEINIGPLNDVLLGGGTNILFAEGSDFFVWLIGPVWKFNIPGFNLFQVETYFYKQNNVSGTYQITPSWAVSVPITERIIFRTRGFVDFIGGHGLGATQIIAQPQFHIDLGNVFGNSERIYLGTEWHYWKNVGGEPGFNESIPQFQLMVQF